jgi:tetratricopeptide (TPR) repeat protein
MSFSSLKFIHLKLIFVFILICNIATWLYARDFQAKWFNVPPVPSVQGAEAFSVGDKAFSYRSFGIMLQNLGDTGGRSTALDDYNYDELSKWFLLLNKLDPESHFVPFLASYYFGAVQDTDKLYPLVDYLSVVGQRPGAQRWRWLGQAVYLARFEMNDLDFALELAHQLAKIEDEDAPAWTKQMPAFVYNARGNKEEALAVMMEILRTSADKIHPNEVNHTRDYICNRLLEESEAAQYEFCEDIP